MLANTFYVLASAVLIHVYGIISHIINCKIKISSENSFFFFFRYMFLLRKFAFNIQNVGGFRVTFLATELRMVGYVLCFSANKIGHVQGLQ